jgi:exodeoxyribonuclease-3
MRIATWNINSIRAREERALGWTAANQPDILCLQEIKIEDAEFPTLSFRGLGYEAAVHGQRTYNGVAILSKLPIADVVRGFGDGGDESHSRFIAATVGGIRLYNVYVPNGQAPGTDKYAFKIEWMARLGRYLRAHAGDGPALLLGDFNVAPADMDVHDPVAWKEQIMCTSVERAALARIVEPGWTDTLRAIHPDLKVFTWWDYRQLSFPKGKGLRIDHIFATAPVAARVRDVKVDREARKGKQPSDHAPVIAELAS